jgi:hypothetical protein
VRLAFVPAAAYQRTSYLPGEVAQVDWWHTGLAVPVGKGRVREAFGLVATLPASAAVGVVFTLARTTAEYCAALLGCLERLGGLLEAVVSDNDAGIVASRKVGGPPGGGGGRAVWGAGLAAGGPAPPPSAGQGQVERSIGYLETSFVPLRAPADLADLQAQADQWTVAVADDRFVRRLGARVADALAVERASLRRLPERWPDVDRRLEVRASRDGFVRWPAWTTRCRHRWPAAALGAAVADRRQVCCESTEVACHRLSAWAEIFGDAVAVAAMVARLVHHAEIISLKGDSYRLKDRRKEVDAAG